MSKKIRDKGFVHKIIEQQYWLDSKVEDTAKPQFVEPLKGSRLQSIYERVLLIQKKYCPDRPMSIPKVEFLEPLFPVDIFNNITLKERGFVVAPLKKKPTSDVVSIPITRLSRDEPAEPWRLNEKDRKRIKHKPVVSNLNIDTLYTRLLKEVCKKERVGTRLWTVSLKEMFDAINEPEKMEGIELIDLIPALIFGHKNVATWSINLKKDKNESVSEDSGCEPSTSFQSSTFKADECDELHEYVIVQSDPEWTLYGIKGEPGKP